MLLEHASSGKYMTQAVLCSLLHYWGVWGCCDAKKQFEGTPKSNPRGSA